MESNLFVKKNTCQPIKQNIRKTQCVSQDSKAGTVKLVHMTRVGYIEVYLT